MPSYQWLILHTLISSRRSAYLFRISECHGRPPNIAYGLTESKDRTPYLDRVMAHMLRIRTRLACTSIASKRKTGVGASCSPMFRSQVVMLCSTPRIGIISCAITQKLKKKAQMDLGRDSEISEFRCHLRKSQVTSTINLATSAFCPMVAVTKHPN
jgi:hypothetical protein